MHVRIVGLVTLFFLGCSQEPIESCRRARIIDFLEAQIVTAQDELHASVAEKLRQKLLVLRNTPGNTHLDFDVLEEMKFTLGPLPTPKVRTLVKNLNTIQGFCLGHCDVHRQLWEHP